MLLIMEKYPLSIDTALEAIGLVTAATFKELQGESNPERIQTLRNKLEILHKEMDVIYGEGDEKTRMEVYNKINDIYCPQIKARFLTPEYEPAID
jgi:hypothetical protein